MIFTSRRGVRKWVFRGILTIFLGSTLFLASIFLYGLVTENRPPAQIDVRYYQNIIGDQKVIALTFDDGPIPGRTEPIMEILKNENVPATFFFIGSRMLRYPSLVKEATDNGFEIGNHSFTHSGTVHSSAWRLRLELNLTNTVYEAITNQPLRLYRPPFLLDIGSDPTTQFPGSRPDLSWATHDGYVVVGADVDPKDWLAQSPTAVVDDLIAKLGNNGHLVLLHDGSSEHYTVKALPGIIEELRKRGYTFATASQVLGLDASDQLRVTQNINLGDNDKDTNGPVTHLQKFLIFEGYVIDDHSGLFGPSTEKALKAWQEKNNLQAESGKVESDTRHAIVQAVNGSMYQPLPPSKLSDVFLFTHASQLYIFLSPIIGQVVVWTVRVVLVLALLRLVSILILLVIAMFRKKHRPAPWEGHISVIIPAYNEEDNIASTVASVLNNTMKDIEILVMDDGSTDKTAEIVHGIERKHPKRVRLYSLENGGKARALNFGLRLAKYDVVVTMDADTIFDRYTISRLVRHFNDPAVGAVAGKVCATRSRNLLNLFQWVEYVITQNMDKRAYNIVNAIGVVPGPVGAWRKSLVLAEGGFSRDTLVEDQDMTMAILASGHQVVYEPQAFAYSETPFTLKDFMKQRSRWIFGTIQCLWKYKRYMLNVRHPALGWVILPTTFLFTVILSLLIPLMDFLLIITFIVGFGRSTFIFYAIFAGIDFAYAGLAFLEERSKHWLISLLPVQRLFYRAVIALVVWRSIVKAIEGTSPRWNKVRKRGDAHADHQHMLSQTVAEVVTAKRHK